MRYTSTRDGRFVFEDGTTARIHSFKPGTIDAEIGGVRSPARITRNGEDLVVQTPRGDLLLTVLPRFASGGSGDSGGGLEAPMPGKVIQLHVAVGDNVRAGQTVAVLEAMKMEHPMDAPEDGVVKELLVEVGQQVESGTLLVVVEPKSA